MCPDWAIISETPSIFFRLCYDNFMKKTRFIQLRNIFFLLDLRLYRKMCDSIEVSRVKILDALVIGKFNEAVEVTNLPLCPLKYNHLSISRFTTISFRWPIWSERSRSTFSVIGWEGQCLSFIEWISKSFFYQLL